MNMEHVGIALEIMGKGMGGIFAAIIIIMAAVMVLGCITKPWISRSICQRRFSSLTKLLWL